MNATVLDLRKNMKDVMAAIDRNEQVTLTYRGNKKAIIIPCRDGFTAKSAADHPAFGMWADHKKLDDVNGYIRGLRKGRYANG